MSWAARARGSLRILIAAALLGASVLAEAVQPASPGGGADGSGSVRIGVLAFQGAEAASVEWSPVLRRLRAALPELRFDLAPLDHEGLDKAAAAGEVDLVITNPGHYVELESEVGASRILTLDAGRMRTPERAVGSAVVSLASRERLTDLRELKGRRVAVVGREAFGGYQLVWRELAALGIDPGRDLALLDVGFPMDGVLGAVERGEADAGIVRVCLIESRREWSERFRVVGARAEPGFACATSTRLYPDWPVATLRHTPPQLARAVAIALLGMSVDRDGMAWSVPADYQPVHELFRELRIGPYEYLREPRPVEIARRYWQWVAAFAFLIAAWIVYTVRVEHQVHARTAQLREALQAREALEARARANQEQADHLARLSVLGELSGTLAHELNQPLAAIGNYAQSLVRRVDNERLTAQAARQAALEMADQAERAAGILGRIRGFAHKRPAQRERVAAADVAREAVALFRGMLAAAPEVAVIDELPPGRAIEVDPLQVQQVLLNLLKNGHDAERGLPPARRRLELRIFLDGGSVRFAVRDFGAGLEEPARARLFEPFFTTKPDGLGLGLSICKTIAESHGGRLSAEPAADGPGMVFVLAVPDS